MKRFICKVLVLFILVMGLPIAAVPIEAADVVVPAPMILQGAGGTFLLTSDGEVWTWGFNWGTLGDGTNTNRYSPIFIMDDVFHISSDRSHTVAIRNDGSLWAWGSNWQGQLGDGTTENRPSPIRIKENVAYATARDRSTWAITTDGRLYAWGRNHWDVPWAYSEIGILGDGTIIDRHRPTFIMDNVSHVAHEDNWTIAILTDASMWRWGRFCSSTPAPIFGNVAHSIISTNGPQLTLGLDGRLRWFGAAVAFWTPDLTREGYIIDNVASFSVGFVNAMVIRNDGSLWAFGDNRSGSLGMGFAYYDFTFDAVMVLDDVVQVATHQYAKHTMAIRGDGSLWGWGDNSYGQLGDGTTVNRYSPIRIMDNVLYVSVHQGRTFVVRTDGSLWAFGRNGGVLGDGTDTDRHSPVLMMNNVVTPGAAIERNLPGMPYAGRTTIYNASQLAEIGGPRSAGRMFVLANDIYISSGWTPIQDFAGTLYGGGHTITFSSHIRANTTLLTTIGLFESVTEGSVTIRNLNVTTGRQGSLTASAPRSTNSRAYAGGLIGMVTGGSVFIENVTFDGSVSASATYCKTITAANNLLDDIKFGKGLVDLSHDLFETGKIPKWLSNISTAVTVGQVAKEWLHNAHLDELERNGSRAYAGGFIGFVGGDAYVRIVNSYARGSVSANAGASAVDLTAFVGAVRARAFAGGLVGLRTGTARLVIYNSYVTNNIRASAAAPVFASPDSNSGALVGNGSFTTEGTAFRHDGQNLHVNRVFRLLRSSYGNTNTNGITRSLTRAQMQNQDSFTNWDFINVWDISPTVNNGFPFIRFNAIILERVFGSFSGDFSFTLESGTPIVFSADMPFLDFRGAQVNGINLTQDVDYVVTDGSTQITLLPVFLDSLDDGFHTLTVNFEGDVFAEEMFLIIEPHETYWMTVERLYHEGNLIYTSELGLLVDESFFDTLYGDSHFFVAEFCDGLIVEEMVNFGDAAGSLLFGTVERNGPGFSGGGVPAGDVIPAKVLWLLVAFMAVVLTGLTIFITMRQVPHPKTQAIRMSLIFLIDVSPGMRPYIQSLNTALNRFKARLDADTASFLDVSFIQFGNTLFQVQERVNVNQIMPITQISQGYSDFNAPLNEAMRILHQTKTGQVKPWVVLICADNYAYDISQTVRFINSLQNGGKLRLIALSAGGNNADALKSLTNVVFKLDGTDFTAFFDWVLQSILTIKATSPGHKPNLPPLHGNVYRVVH